MFTSKKAQYLNKDFDRISPITNIDSLYYEQARYSIDNSANYIIERHSVAKNMPIRFNVYDNIISNTANIITTDDYGSYIENVSLNINLKKIFLQNPKNNHQDNTPVYDNSVFEIESPYTINLQDLLKNYVPLQVISSSDNDAHQIINSINDDISNNINVSINNIIEDISTFYNYDTSNYYTYNQVISNPNNRENDILNLIYYPYEKDQTHFAEDSSFIIKVQNIGQNFVSLDVPLSYNSDDVSIAYTSIHYDFDSSQITYLKDKNGNEANFDFINAKSPYNIICNNTKNNRFYINSIDDSILISDNCENNEIYYSTNVDLQDNCKNNIIRNSNALNIFGRHNNKVINSSNYYLCISGNNNIIVGCNDCSISINGNNNILVNLQNQDIIVQEDNNIIINDSSKLYSGSQIIKSNNKLFFNDSIRFYITHRDNDVYIQRNSIIFGSSDNSISVYSQGFVTTNK